MALFNNRNLNKDNSDDRLINQWEKCVEMANSASDKRISANGMYLTINLAIIALITFSFEWKSIVVSVLGIGVSIFWFISIGNYKRLNQIKYGIINALEEKLPAAPFTEEWERLERRKKNGKKKKRRLLTDSERVLPLFFVMIYVVCILIPILCQ